MPDTSTPVVPGQKDTDPTALTREMILREKLSLREIVETRLDAMDKAIALLQAYPTEVDRKVGQLKELTEEQFKSVYSHFESNKLALDTALATTKEAAGKVEGFFTKNMDAIVALIAAHKNEAEGRISDIKDRLTIIESVKKGASENWGAIAGVIGGLAGVASVIGLIIVVLNFPAAAPPNGIP